MMQVAVDSKSFNKDAFLWRRLGSASCCLQQRTFKQKSSRMHQTW